MKVVARLSCLDEGPQATVGIEARREAWGVLCLSVCLSGVALGCDPERLDEAGVFTVFATDCRTSRAMVVRDREIAQFDGTSLGVVANDVGLARYRLGGQRRAWILEEDLEDGVTGGDILRLPPLLPGTLERELDVGPFDTSKWTSVRVSDVGYCSLEVGWGRVDLLAQQLGLPRGGFANLLTDAVDGSLIDSENIVGG